MGGIILVALVLRYAVSPIPSGMALVVLVGGIFISIIPYLVKKNVHIQICGYAFLGCLDLLCIFAGFYNGGMRAPVTVAFTLTPIFGFLANGRKGAKVALIASSISIAAIVTAEYLGLSHELLDPNNYSLYKGIVMAAATMVAYSLAAAYEDSRSTVERNLYNERQNTKSILEATPACVKIIDKDCRLISMNEIGLKLIEAEQGFEQVKGQNISKLLLPDYQKAFIEMNARICQGGKHESMCFEVLTLKGAKKWMETHSAPIVMADGSTANLGITHDVTQHKLSEIRKTNYTNAITLIAKKTPLLSILDSIARDVEATNPRLICSILLLDESRRHLHSGAGPSLPEFYSKAIDGIEIGPHQGSCGTAVATKQRVIVSDIQRDPLWLPFRELAAQAQFAACWSEPIMAGDEVLGTLAIYTHTPSLPSEDDLKMVDSSAKLVALAIQHYQSEEAIIQQRGQLISTSKMAALGEMAGGVAHEINSPLAVIIGKASQMKKMIGTGSFAPERLVADITKIETTAHRIAKIVSGLRSFSRNADHDPMVQINIHQIIEDTLALCSEKFKHRTIDLKIKIDVPAETIVVGRQAQLEQVILNLLNNAHDAILGLPEKWVALEALATEENIQIAVTDSGHGIPANIVDKMMQPFFTTKEVGKGTGLGLSISKGIVEAHGGDFFYDKNSKNTRFVVVLPLASAHIMGRSSRQAG